jgi:hypothetical protein
MKNNKNKNKNKKNKKNKNKNIKKMYLGSSNKRKRRRKNIPAVSNMGHCLILQGSVPMLQGKATRPVTYCINISHTHTLC